MTDVFFTADTHFFFHGNIVKYCHRPFLCSEDQAELARRGGRWHNGSWKGEYDKYKIHPDSIKLMNDTLMYNINKTVGANDILYILGDLAFGSKDKYFQNVQWVRNNINCREVYLAWGNHDQPSELIHALFTNTFDHGTIVVNKQKIFLDHYANAIWEKSHRNAWHLYGHSHAEAEEMLESIMPGRKAMDVGVDNAFKILGEYRPFSFDEIKNILGKKPGWFFKKELSEAHKQPEETHNV